MSDGVTIPTHFIHITFSTHTHYILDADLSCCLIFFVHTYIIYIYIYTHTHTLDKESTAFMAYPKGTPKTTCTVHNKKSKRSDDLHSKQGKYNFLL